MMQSPAPNVVFAPHCDLEEKAIGLHAPQISAFLLGSMVSQGASEVLSTCGASG